MQRADGTFTKDEDVGKTLRQLKKEGKLVDLDTVRAWYAATSKFPTKRHRVPSIDGACGKSSVETIINTIGLTMQWLPGSDKGRNRGGSYLLREATRAERKQYKERNQR